ncbi:MAG: NAD(+) synthase [Endomicrobium sp.]|jgi:NAD+ synthase (glutamine-hydrolysing)|nr:NAD(+) synthase [Endomicrobium sp.]
MKYGLIKVAAATPKIDIANPKKNTEKILELINIADRNNVELIVFPELCLTGYTCGDLFLSDVLIKAVKTSLHKLCFFTRNKNILVFVGAPIQKNDKLYSCAIAIQNGIILGIIPKTFLPSYSEFYENRYFISGANTYGTINLCNQKVNFGTNILFYAKGNNNIKVAAEICEDMFVVFPPSSYHAQAGATIIVNLSASNELISKNKLRKILIQSQSARLLSGYIYSSAGKTESVSDMIFSGYKAIVENGEILKDSKLFKNKIIISDIDVNKIVYERRKINVFRNNLQNKYRKIYFNFKNVGSNIIRYISPTPFISCIENAESILQMQSISLAEKLKRTNLNAVIGISGGLDSCLTILIALRSYKLLGRNKKNIIAITMPGPGTSCQTKRNVLNLANTLGISIRKINILDSIKKHIENIQNRNIKINNNSVTYENAQARERIQILMDIANAENGLVVGSNDLSENALGWCTYNGDQMSMYAINASIPKTLVKYLIAYEAKRINKYKQTLISILNTDISPELLPLTNPKKISQKTENIIGPYELHDFFLYYTICFGQAPDKIIVFAHKAFKKKYTIKDIKKYFRIFIKRFFLNQFKRNCMPDAPKIGIISLSSRSDWRMPSDSNMQEWLNYIK